MLKLTITNIEEYNNYTLTTNNKNYNLILEFHGNKIPSIGDIIYLSNKFLTETNIYSFGPLNSKYSKNLDINEEEIIKIVTKTEEYHLQRYYG